jgi:hypothetical protein
MLVALMLAAGFGFIVWRDAELLQTRGVRVGSLSPAAWGIGTFFFAVVFGVLYLVLRPRAIRASAGSCPNCGRPLHRGDQFCGGCGCPIRFGADQNL